MNTFGFSFLSINILKILIMIKPTCNLNQDSALIKSQYICCCARVCIVSAVKVIYILNTHMASRKP